MKNAKTKLHNRCIFDPYEHDNRSPAGHLLPPEPYVQEYHSIGPNETPMFGPYTPMGISEHRGLGKELTPLTTSQPP